jgi:transposase-like protein
MGKHYPKEVKLEAIRMYYEEGMSQRAITEALGIRDQYRVKKWIKAYRHEGLAAFDKMKNRVSLGRSPKKENTQAYIARLEMENALLKKYHTELRKQVLAKRNIGSSTTTDKNTK